MKTGFLSYPVLNLISAPKVPSAWPGRTVPPAETLASAKSARPSPSKSSMVTEAVDPRLRKRVGSLKVKSPFESRKNIVGEGIAYAQVVPPIPVENGHRRLIG